MNLLDKLFWFCVGGFFASLIISFSAEAADYSTVTAKWEVEYNIEPGLLTAICYTESHWKNVRGAHGEIGVCQIKPSTIRMICPTCSTGRVAKVYSYGSTGEVVRKIQEKAGTKPDGIWGDLTEAAVRRYQLAHDIAVDGIVGPQTWGIMFPNTLPPGKSIEVELFNPETNIMWAARYIRWIMEYVSDDPMIIAASYNGGPANQIVKYMLKIEDRLDRIQY